MPNIFKKILISTFVTFVVFFVVAPKLSSVNACVTNLECAINKDASGCIANPNPGPGQQKFICGTAVTTAVNNAVSEGLSDTPNWYDQNFFDWYGKVYDPTNASEIFGERYTAAQVQWVFFGVFSQIMNLPGPGAATALVCIISRGPINCGPEITNVVQALTYAQPSEPKSFLSFFDSQPLSGIGYVRQKINNFHLIPEANAQGTGFDAASPIQKLWVAFRNLTFGLMVIVVLIMAFMIMFRVKISPQVVITVQSALPKIAGALVLITFSYAIAGFMIDIMYLVMGMLASFLSLSSSAISSLSATEIFKTLNEGSTFNLSLQYLFYVSIASFSFLVGTATSGVGAFWGGAGGGLLGIILFIAMFIVLIFAWFKIMWLLLKSYATILIQIALGPIQILLGTITPFGGFGAWLKGLAGNLAIYPVVGFMYVLAFFFLAQAFPITFPPPVLLFFKFPFGINLETLANQSTWSPPLTAGGDFLGLLWIGASVAIMSLIPKTAEIIQSTISGKPFAFGTAIGEAISPITTAASGAIAAKITRIENISGDTSSLGSFLRTTGIIRK